MILKIILFLLYMNSQPFNLEEAKKEQESLNNKNQFIGGVWIDETGKMCFGKSHVLTKKELDNLEPKPYNNFNLTDFYENE